MKPMNGPHKAPPDTIVPGFRIAAGALASGATMLVLSKKCSNSIPGA